MVCDRIADSGLHESYESFEMARRAVLREEAAPLTETDTGARIVAAMGMGEAGKSTTCKLVAARARNEGFPDGVF